MGLALLTCGGEGFVVAFNLRFAFACFACLFAGLVYLFFAFHCFNLVVKKRLALSSPVSKMRTASLFDVERCNGNLALENPK